jgi:multicomponent Na+:H+ antiporter subunit F
VNLWILASALLLLAIVPAGVACFRGKTMHRLVGLEIAEIITTVLLVTLAEAMKQPSFFDLALALAILSYGGGLVFARFLERWL